MASYGNTFGCRSWNNPASKQCSNSAVLTDNEFALRGKTFQVTAIQFISDTHLQVNFDTTILRGTCSPSMATPCRWATGCFTSQGAPLAETGP